MDMSTVTIVRRPAPFVDDDALRLAVTAEDLFRGWQCQPWLFEYVDQLLEYGPLGQAAALGMVSILWDGPFEPITGRPRRMADEQLDTPVARARRILAAAGPDWTSTLYQQFTMEVGGLLDDLEDLEEDAPPDYTLAFALRRGELFAVGWATLALPVPGLFQLMENQLRDIDELAAVRFWTPSEEIRQNPILREMHAVDETAWWARLILY